LFSYLVRHRGDLPILLVATLRKEDTGPVPGIVKELQDDMAEVMELAPLSYEEHVQLIHSMLLENGVGTVRADTITYIHQLAEGNPLYAIELLRHYTSKGFPDSSDFQEESGVLPSTSVSEKIPASIRHMVEQKLENISPAAHHLLNIAAVIGKQVSYEILASIWSAGNENGVTGLFNALEEVIRAGLLVEHGLDYSFGHALVQETIYASISEARRHILHRQIAGKLLDNSDDDKVPVVMIAWHHLEAGDLLEGARYLLKAGKCSKKPEPVRPVLWNSIPGLPTFT
jgi:predicted ATPase